MEHCIAHLAGVHLRLRISTTSVTSEHSAQRQPRTKRPLVSGTWADLLSGFLCES